MSEIVAEARENAIQLENSMKAESVEVSETVEENTEATKETTETEEIKVVEPEVEATETVEPDPEAEAVVEEPDQFGQKFDVLKRREKAIRAKEQTIKDSQADYQEWKVAQEQAKTDPLGFLDKAGISYDDITNALLSGGEQQAAKGSTQDLEARIAKFEKAEIQRQEETTKTKQFKEAEEYMGSFNKFVDESEKFDLIKATSSQQLVIDTIVEHYNSTQEELEWGTACDIVEDHLWETEVTKMEKVLAIDKMKEKLGINKTESPAEVVKKPKTKTLSNSNTAAAPDRKAVDRPEQLKK